MQPCRKDTINDHRFALLTHHHSRPEESVSWYAFLAVGEGSEQSKPVAVDLGKLAETGGTAGQPPQMTVQEVERANWSAAEQRDRRTRAAAREANQPQRRGQWRARKSKRKTSSKHGRAAKHDGDGPCEDSFPSFEDQGPHQRCKHSQGDASHCTAFGTREKTAFSRSARPPDHNAEQRQKSPFAAIPRPARDKRKTSRKQAPDGG